jgi:hypothetical protein
LMVLLKKISDRTKPSIGELWIPKNPHL